MTVLVVGVIAFVQYRYQGPMPFIAESEGLIAEAQKLEEQIEAEVIGIDDPKEASDRREELRESLEVGEKWGEAITQLQLAFKHARDNKQLRMALATNYFYDTNLRAHRVGSQQHSLEVLG